jgi:DNA-directed RNA polymerase specialized sigma24 family protein
METNFPTSSLGAWDFLSQLKHFQPVMRAIARQWSTDRPADEDDLLQEMALELWLTLQHRPDAPREYLTTALRRVPWKYRRRGSSVDRLSHKRRTHHQWQIESLESLTEHNGNDGNHNHDKNWGSPVEDNVIARLMQAELEERLTHRQAAFLQLRLRGYSPKEIHEEFGLSKPQVNGLAVKIRAKACILWDGDGPACATLTEAARELGLPLRTANTYCHRGMLDGARFERGRWLIPRPIKLLL